MKPFDVFLLDTNVCIGFLKGHEKIVERLGALHPNKLRLCSAVKAELFYGARASAAPAENLRRLRRFLSPYISLPFDDACAEQYGTLRAELRRLGQPIGANDMFIAATAMVYDVTLVTHNTREFARVPGLLLEDWEV